jgi:predicted nucleotidyltransferase
MIISENLTEDENKAINEIREEVVALAGNKLKGFYLFGSKARGDYDPESDVDIAIIVDELDRELKKKIIDIVVKAEVKYIVVIFSLVLSLQEFTELKNRERRIALDIEREGIQL